MAHVASPLGMGWIRRIVVAPRGAAESLHGVDPRENGGGFIFLPVCPRSSAVFTLRRFPLDMESIARFRLFPLGAPAPRPPRLRVSYALADRSRWTWGPWI